MTHINMFILILAVAVGVGGITVLFQDYAKHGYPYLREYGIHLLSLNVLILISVVFNYIFENLFDRSESITAVIIEVGYRVSGCMVSVVFVYTFILLSRRLLQKEVPQIFKKIYFGVAVLLLLVVSAFGVLSIMERSHIPVLLSDLFATLLTFSLVMVSNIYLVVHVKYLEDKEKRDAVSVFAWLYLIPGLSVLLFIALHVMLVVSNNALLVFVFIYCMMVNGMPLLYLK